jgi:hypothetical protein
MMNSGTHSNAAQGISHRLRLALWGGPILTIAAFFSQWYWRFPPLSVGAGFAAKSVLLGGIVGSVSAVIAIYQLISYPSSRTVERLVLASVNVLMLLSCITMGIALVSRG